MRERHVDRTAEVVRELCLERSDVMGDYVRRLPAVAQAREASPLCCGARQPSHATPRGILFGLTRHSISTQPEADALSWVATTGVGDQPAPR